MKRQNGFTLIEVMIVVVVVAILATLAIPSYREYVIRSHRRAAQAEMMQIATQQQQYFVANRTYATVDQLGYALPPEVDQYYNYSVTLGGAVGVAPNQTFRSFVINFAADGSQASDGSLALTSEGVKTPAEKW